ncbi:ABC transporter substrate-binding protein [Mammaliicoccus sciuri]|uniref:siderophore ABC transporter substrate-binding protein n=1 Tax=Mammaliicoccus sciuri TaxID=1296 RepID=UPI001F29897E|nr:ABC transporter substrate-binding protein [Mammaliicoccus sciuri]MCE4979512.1 ABC transporter substrate-binding protein [Mammaliicoccus sciuri]MCE5084140.1 ABC transporter substrate-binding protein [Mammaliicoccus sciuri]MCE5093712.1 ABC transporter substrate-binding protein [Mammaliicoccus sciuri]
MKKYITVIVCVLLLLSACSNSKGEVSHKDTVTIKNTFEYKEKNKDHNRGKKKTETLTIPKNPKKVIVMDYGALDIMKDLKLQKHITAIPKGPNGDFLPSYLSEFKDDKYTNLGNPGRPNFEKIAEEDPDLILISFRQAYTKNLKEFKKAAPNAKVLYVSPDDDRYIESIKENAQNIGKIFDKENETQSLIKKLDQKVKSVKNKVNDDTVMFANIDQKGIKTYGKTGRYGGFLSGDLGIKHIDQDMPANSSGQLVSYEYIAEKNPDKIFYINRTDDDSKGLPQELENPVIKNVSAIKNKDILKFDSNTWFFGSGGISSTIKQLDDIEKAY